MPVSEFLVVVVTDPATKHTHTPTDRTDYSTLRRSFASAWLRPGNVSNRDLNPNSGRGLPITRTAAIVTASDRAV